MIEVKPISGKPLKVKKIKTKSKKSKQFLSTKTTRKFGSSVSRDVFKAGKSMFKWRKINFQET